MESNIFKGKLDTNISRIRRDVNPLELGIDFMSIPAAIFLERLAIMRFSM
jgi:hypothetical protein